MGQNETDALRRIVTDLQMEVAQWRLRAMSAERHVSNLLAVVMQSAIDMRQADRITSKVTKDLSYGIIGTTENKEG